MKKIILSLFCLLTISTLKAQEYSINSEKSIVEFNYVSEDAVGTINGVKGTIKFDPSDLSKSYFEGRADISTINTGNKTRDAHLNAPDYFDTEKYPEIIFKSESLSMVNEEYVMKGKMTIKDISNDEEATQKAIKLNNGIRRIPVIVFEDQSILVEPNREELLSKLG